MAAFDFLPAEYGYVIAVAIAFWIQQNIIFVIPVAMQRQATGIQPPVLYPNDSLIKELQLNSEKVNKYMCAQRVHQNNLEFLAIFFPLFLIAGLYNPVHTAAAGAMVWVGRMITAVGYWSAASKRVYGAWFHFPEWYIIYMAGMVGYSLIQKLL